MATPPIPLTIIAGAPNEGNRVPSGMVRLKTVGAAVTMIRNGDIDFTGGVGGWQTSDRVLRRAASWWQATPLRTGTIPTLLDFDALPIDSVEGALNDLYAMGQPIGDGDPPAVRVSGDAPRMAGIDWRLDEIELGAILYRPHAPTKLRRIEMTLTFTELKLASGVSKVSVRRTRDSSTVSKTRQVTVRAGDTLRSIAVKQLGQSSDYTQIQGWNASVAHTDPDAPLRAGIVLILK